MESAESLSCFICVFTYLINYSETLTYYVPEEQPKGSIIGNIAASENLRDMMSEETFNNLQFYFLDRGNIYLSHFSIDSTTSVLTVNKTMDRETICKFSNAFTCPISFEVAAQEKIGTFFRKIIIQIEIEDINDHPPVFDPDYRLLTLSESVIEGTPITIDGATDKDSVNFTVKSYKIFPVNAPFKTRFLQYEDGNSELSLVVDGELDRETVDNYILELFAFDSGSSPLNGSMVINITIEDANDNRPMFEKLVYNVTVKENVPINTTIITVKANDIDIGENAEFYYQLSTQQEQEIKDTFEVNSTTGEITVIGHLEYTSNNIKKVKVEAIDKGDRPLSSQTVVEVIIEDSENFPPEIKLNLLSTSGSAETSEYAGVGAVVAHVEVLDSDGDRNGLVDCDIAENEHFGLVGLESDEFKVIVIKSLDREKKDKFDLTIYCHDYGVPRLNSSANFTVRVIDENDNKPVFSEPTYNSSVLENNDEGYTVVQVYAEDADIGMNGQVSYYLDPKDRDDFHINPSTGLVTANIEFDREDVAGYNVWVVAVDAGNPPLSATATIYVTIEDENDNAPKFEKDHPVYHVPESDIKETILGSLLATDADMLQNNEVSYSLVGNYSENFPFQVLPDGTVKSVRALDREMKERYEFTVMAIDNGKGVRMNSTVNVTVKVTDMNDNYPEVIYPQDQNVVKYITYMMPAKTLIMKIEARDKDEGKHADLIYNIDKRNDSNMFELGRNGEVYVARKMYETDINLYELEVTVSDQGIPPKTTWAHVKIVVLSKNVTELAVTDGNTDSQNIIIAVVVVVITVIIAATILLIMWLVRRKDLLKRKLMETRHNGNQNGGDNDSGFSSNGGRKTPDALKMFDSTLMPTGPMIQHSGGINKIDGKSKDVKFQDEVHVREKSVDSTAETQNTVQLHRLASIRLHQALVQSQDKHWSSQNELSDNPNGKDMKRQEDIHSDLSADTATYDSGIGGSVSDTGDLRLAHLQQIVRQSGRRGQPPHKYHNHISPSKPPRIIARGRTDSSSDIPPERPPPIKHNPYMTRSPVSPVHSPVQFSPPISPTKFTTSSPTPYSPNQVRYTAHSPTKMNMLNYDNSNSSSHHSPSRNVVQDLLMYKKFQNGLKPGTGRLMIDESVDTTHFDDDESTTSGSYYIDNTIEDLQHPHVSDIYV